MKKIVILALALIMVLACFAACGDTAETTTENKEAETTLGEHEHVWATEPDAAQSVAPTCTKTGKNVYVCTVAGCTETKSERVDRVDHVAAAPATCTEPSRCAMCNKELAPVIDHTFGEPVVVDFTCTTDGSKTEKCTVCGFEKVTKLPAAHKFVAEPIPGTDFIKNVCSICQYSETSIETTDIVKLDFETELSAAEYISAQDGFQGGINNSSGAGKINAAADGNKYLTTTAQFFINDDNMALFKTEQFVVEFDVMFDNIPTGNNKSVFTFLPQGGLDETGVYNSTDMVWMWLMKINSTKVPPQPPQADDEGLNNQPEDDGAGKMVVYGGCAGYPDKINTNYHFTAGQWAHVTYVIDWAAGTYRVFVGETGKKETYSTLIANGTVELSDGAPGMAADDPKKNDGEPDMTRDMVTRMAFRFGENGLTANFDNFHAYTSTGNMPLWMAE